MCGVDRFCLRQFDDPQYMGTQIRFDKVEFERKVNEIYLARNKELVDGYVYVALWSCTVHVRPLGAMLTYVNVTVATRRSVSTCSSRILPTRA